MIARPIVHLHDQHLTARARLDVVAMLRVLTNTAGGRAGRTLSRGAGRIACLVRMPFRLTVIAEAQEAAGPLALDARTGRAAARYDRVATVGRRTPARIGIVQQDAPHHKVLVLGHDIRLADQQALNVARMHRFATLGTR